MSASASTISQPQVSPPRQAVKAAIGGLFLITAALWFSYRALLSTNFLPHWYCYVGNKRLVWTNVIADLVIGVSYVVISLTLAWLVRRAGRDLPYTGFFWAFGLFIVSCGATHFMEVITIWRPVYWLSAAVKIVTAAASAGTGVVLLVAADDIVDFVRTGREAAIRRGHDRYRALIDAVPLAVVGSDLEKRVTDWNPAAKELFGWTAEEVVGRLPLFAPPEKAEERAAVNERARAGEVVKSIETIRLNRKGERILVSLSAAGVYDETGELSGFLGVFEDISERKRIETELQEKTAALSAVTQALNAFLDTGDWKAASKHLLTFALRQTQSTVGFLGVVLDGPVLRVLSHDGVVRDLTLNGEIHEEKMSERAPGNHLEMGEVHNLLGEVIAKGETVVANSLQTDSHSAGVPPGHLRTDSFLGVPIFKGHETVGLIGVANRPGGYAGQEVRYLKTMSQATGVLYDNYRQTLKHAALEEQQERLEAQVRQAQKMEVLGRLAGGVAHDFNNMLMVLGGCSELLERSLPKETPARIYLDQMQRATEKASAITKQLLAFSRKQVLEVRPMDLHAALTESEFMIPRLLGSDIVLTIRHEAARSWLLSDPSQIQQVVANLAINSRDAMPEGGALAISTRNTTQLPVEDVDVVSEVSEWVVLGFGDTGCGMDEETRAQIFEPFFTTKPAGKGTGLGLATVYGIVKQSGGFIRVDSAPGKGTRFELYFPTVEPQAAAAQPVASMEPTEQTGDGATVLVADDETALRHAIVEILRTSGYKVFESQTAEEALEIARQQADKIDVLLTDIVMPGLRGTELARRVTKIHPEIQVIYMSGYAEGFSEAQLPPNSTFLQKPFRFATLLEQLKLVRRRA